MANADQIKKEIIALGTARDGEIYCTEIRNSLLKFYGFNSINYHSLSRILTAHSVTAQLTVHDSGAAVDKTGLVIAILLSQSEPVANFPKVLHAQDLKNTPFEYANVTDSVFSGSTTMHSYAFPKAGFLTQTLDAVLNHPSTIRIFVKATCLQIIELLDRRIRDGLAESMEKLRQNQAGRRWRHRARVATLASNHWNARSSTGTTGQLRAGKSTCGRLYSRNCQSSTTQRTAHKTFATSFV